MFIARHHPTHSAPLGAACKLTYQSTLCSSGAPSFIKTGGYKHLAPPGQRVLELVKDDFLCKAAPNKG